MSKPSEMVARDVYEQTQATLDAVRRDRDEMKADRDRWRDQRVPDGEANCISECVGAVERLLSLSTNTFGSGFRSVMQSYVGEETPKPDARDMAVGRVLLHLAARYGVPLFADGAS